MNSRLAKHLFSFQVLTEKRRLGGRDGPPHLVAVVSLHTDVDASIVTKMLRRETVGGIVHQEQCVSGLGDSFGLILPRFKQRFTFLHQDTGKLHPRRGVTRTSRRSSEFQRLPFLCLLWGRVLVTGLNQLTCTPYWTWQRLQTASCLCWTLLKVGTITETTVSLAFLLRASPAMVGITLPATCFPPWDHNTKMCGDVLYCLFLSCVALVCLGVSDLPVKKRVEARRALSKIVEVRFPDTRLFPLDSDQDGTLLLRHLGSQKQRKLGFRSRRSHLLAQCVTFTPNDHSEGSGGGPSGLGTLCVSGYVRGRPLQVDRLVHISGHGDFQLSQIDAPSDPLPLNLATGRSNKSGRGGDVDMQVGAQTFTLLTLTVQKWQQSNDDACVHELCDFRERVMVK